MNYLSVGMLKNMGSEMGMLFPATAAKRMTALPGFNFLSAYTSAV